MVGLQPTGRQQPPSWERGLEQSPRSPHRELTLSAVPLTNAGPLVSGTVRRDSCFEAPRLVEMGYGGHRTAAQ